MSEEKETCCVGVAPRQIKILLEKEGNNELASFMNFVIFRNCVVFQMFNLEYSSLVTII